MKNNFSAEQSIMMSRKPAIASTFFQPLKPFSGLVWGLIAGAILITSFLIYMFNKVYERMNIPYRSKFDNLHDTIYHVRFKFVIPVTIYLTIR